MKFIPCKFHEMNEALSKAIGLPCRLYPVAQWQLSRAHHYSAEQPTPDFEHIPVARVYRVLDVEWGGVGCMTKAENRGTRFHVFAVELWRERIEDGILHGYDFAGLALDTCGDGETGIAGAKGEFYSRDWRGIWTATGF